MALRRRKRDRKQQLLGGVSLLAACSQRELSRICSLTDEIDVPAGRVVTEEGQPGREFFLVVHGRATVKIRGRKVGSLGSGDCFGEMALLDQGPRSATVVADTDMELMVLDSRSFSALIDEVPSVARKLFRQLAERLRASEQAPIY